MRSRQGLTVVWFGQAVAVPFATRQLSDLGRRYARSRSDLLRTTSTRRRKEVAHPVTGGVDGQ
jgi:crotonobetainyl-CoA:carnitine CoA-transferase CaiB-like acyl-CoA transferase